MRLNLRRVVPLGILLILLALAAAPVLMQSASPAQPDPASILFEPVVTSLVRPLYVTHAGDDSGRLFLVEQGGKIWVILDGQRLEQPFLDVSSLISPEATSPSGYSERGLLGLAFHPDYAANGRFFVNYTDLSGNTVVAGYQVSADDPNIANPDSAVTIFTAQQPYSNHNGGYLAFGPDGYLYIGFGDGGSQGDPNNNAQNLGSPLGKILRIDIDTEDAPYAVPADNPFVSTDGSLPEIWALGLRNPWRFSFDRDTGDLWIGDVGGSSWEEVNFQPAEWAGGANYGWNRMEGMHETGAGPVPADHILPVAEYSHGEGISIVGGYVYRGEAIPALQGVYLFGDFGSGTIWTIVHSGDSFDMQTFIPSTGMTISSFGQDEAGDLYVVDYNGTLFRIASAS
ncbi:MAG TPA: PQQ-dependent sugar dehydrogenase [Candidatus Limnocylindrales bacterium]|nr:PQQ-dependent sugar dehydrogenase [Candidatus Limnocylindrales bacterium]